MCVGPDGNNLVGRNVPGWTRPSILTNIRMLVREKYVGQDQRGLTELWRAVGRCTVVVTGGDVAGSVAGWLPLVEGWAVWAPCWPGSPLPHKSEAAGSLEPAGA